MRSFRFPWLLSNVLDAATGQPLGGALRSHIIDWQGVRVGLMGLVEPEVRQGGRQRGRVAVREGRRQAGRQ
jgi:2',3'-cyclic-nucleotide 2'-phosphodiesterase (5'-nucleotidase family)